jgi:hypothetical protein
VAKKILLRSINISADEGLFEDLNKDKMMERTAVREE